jgi:hypothetical protein
MWCWEWFATPCPAEPGRSRLYLLAVLIDEAYCSTWNHISNSTLFPNQLTLRTGPKFEYLSPRMIRMTEFLWLMLLSLVWSRLSVFTFYIPLCIVYPIYVLLPKAMSYVVRRTSLSVPISHFTEQLNSCHLRKTGTKLLKAIKYRWQAFIIKKVNRVKTYGRQQYKFHQLLRKCSPEHSNP